MTDVNPSGRSVIVTDEDADAARARLKAHFAKQQADLSGLSTTGSDDDSADEQADELDNDDEEENDQEEPEPEDARDLFAFTLGESALIEQLGLAIRRRLQAAAPRVLHRVAAVLHAIDRLPYTTPGISIDLAVIDRVGDNMSYVSIEIDDSSIRLSRGGYVFTPGVGGDTYSTTDFEIERGGYRSGETEEFEEWLSAFAAAAGSLAVEGDAEVDFTDQAPDDGWERLANYWESQ
jgi:hypothetical protein